MAKDFTTFKVIWVMFKGFIIAFTLLFIIAWLILILFFQDPEPNTKPLGEDHYYTETIKNIASASAYRNIQIYELTVQQGHYPLVAIIILPWKKGERMELNLTQGRLKIAVDKTIKLDTLLPQMRVLRVNNHRAYRK